jgi:HEPN domain-containing protein
MKKNSQQWINQAEYDLNTAEYMFDGGRFFYSVFMCHLSIEKALKGLYFEKTGKIPPKVHNLIYFLNQLKIRCLWKLGNLLLN